MTNNLKHKVLYLSYDGLTDPLGQSQILPYLCGLSHAYSITIISFEKDERYLAEKNLITDVCTKHNINWLPLRYHKKPPVFSTLYDIWHLRKSVKALHLKNQYKIIHCRSYITSLVGLWMKRKYNVKFIFDMRGFWADERVDGDLWNLKKPVYRYIFNFFKKKEKEFLKAADYIVTLTENAKREILSWDVATPISVIPCCVDTNHFNRKNINTEKQNSLRKDLRLSEKDFILLYLGSLGTWYMIKEMLDFFSVLKQHKPNAKFLIVSLDTWDITNYAYKSDVIIVSAKRYKVPLYISIVSASILFIKPSFSKKASSATKMAEILAMGVPVITNTGWGDVFLFKDTLAGLSTVSEPADYTLVIGKLLTLNTADEIINSAESHFSLTKGINVYKTFYKELCL